MILTSLGERVYVLLKREIKVEQIPRLRAVVTGVTVLLPDKTKAG